MKIDLAGSANRGLAMALNEFAGYFAVAASALATGWIAARYGLRPEPFYLGIGFVAAGLGLSALVVRETKHHVAHESKLHGHAPLEGRRSQSQIFWRTSLLDRNLSSVTPTLLAAIGDVAHPSWRASSVGVYRLGRDLGYAIGALVAGVTADALGIPAAMWMIAALTFGSGLVVAFRMTETLRRQSVSTTSAQVTSLEPTERDTRKEHDTWQKLSSSDKTVVF